MVLEGVDKYDNLFGTVYVPPAPAPAGAAAAAPAAGQEDSLAELLIRAGFAKVRAPGGETRALARWRATLVEGASMQWGRRKGRMAWGWVLGPAAGLLSMCGLCAQCVEWSLALMASGGQRLRELERTAKLEKKGIWTNYVAPPTNQARGRGGAHKRGGKRRDDAARRGAVAVAMCPQAVLLYPRACGGCRPSCPTRLRARWWRW